MATSELSLGQRIELARTIDARIEDRTLIGVAYDGEHLRLLPECLIEGRYVRREGGLEHQLDGSSAVFVVVDPNEPSRFVRVDAGAHTNYRATARIVVAGLPGRPARNDPACEPLTHVVNAFEVGVDADPDAQVEELPFALILDELPIPAPRPAERERERLDELALASAIAAAALATVIIVFCVAASPACTDADDDL